MLTPPDHTSDLAQYLMAFESKPAQVDVKRTSTMTDEEPYAPRRRSNEIKDVNLTGKLMPFEGGEPVLLMMAMSENRYLPLFATKAELETTMSAIGIEYDSIKQIQDGLEFLTSIPATTPEGRQLHVVVDLRFVAPGKFHFSQVARD